MNSLKAAPVWVGYTLIQRPNKPKPDKIPVNPRTLRGAQSDKPNTWASYEQANECYGKTASIYDKETKGYISGSVAGIGFMFADGICGIDLDGIDDNQERELQAQEIIAHMDTYAEQSPSGKGYHLLFRVDVSKIPPNYKTAYYQKNVTAGIECYISGLTNRYFTYTGESITSRDIEDRTDQLLTFLEKYMRKKENPPQPSPATGDSSVKTATQNSIDILSIARKAKNGNKFAALFDMGDISTYKNDDSSADIALCNILAFYCQGDFNMVDELFRQSKLYREKWEREDYRTATISKGIEICGGKFYTPKNSRTKRGAMPLVNIVTSWPGAVYFNPFETPETRHRYSPNDIGAGNFFADVYKNVSRYVPQAKMWYVYDGRVWREDVGGMIVGKQAQDLTDYMMDCRRYLNDEGAREAWVKFVAARMKKAARDTMLSDAEKQYPVAITQFDSNPYLFNCQNCTLDLQSFTMHKHRPEDFISKISNVTFDPSAWCDRWTQFINEIMRGDADTAKYFQKSLGYTLSGNTSEECFFILYGSTTRNGKGTSMETTLHLMGDYGRTAQPETIAQKTNTHSSGPTEDVARLKGARFVNMSEPDKGLRLNSALVKQITGGDTVTARYLHQNSFEYRPEYKLFINTNHRLRINDDSIFASGRVHEIPFERHFNPDEQDKGLKSFFKQPENISGIFNWFIEGLKLMRIEGITPPPAVLAATNEYREESDIIGQFIKDCLMNVPGNKVSAKEVQAEYERWCNDYGYKALNSRNLLNELRKRKLKIANSTGNQVHLFDYGILVNTNDLPQEWQ